MVQSPMSWMRFTVTGCQDRTISASGRWGKHHPAKTRTATSYHQVHIVPMLSGVSHQPVDFGIAALKLAVPGVPRQRHGPLIGLGEPLTGAHLRINSILRTAVGQRNGLGNRSQSPRRRPGGRFVRPRANPVPHRSCRESPSSIGSEPETCNRRRLP